MSQTSAKNDDKQQKNPDITPTKQFIVFVLTFLCYVGLHSMRAAWAYSKSQIEAQYHEGDKFYGAVDVTYLLCYSFGMATIGTMTNRLRLNLYLGIGMILAATCFSSFAIYSQITGDLSVPLTYIGMGLNGFFQSTGWPGMMATMANWFGKGRRGLLLAFWSVNANIGNIVGSVACSNLNGWKMNVFVTSILTCAIGVMIMVFLQPKPKETQKQVEKQSLLESGTDRRQQQQPQVKQINVFTAFCVPKVPYYVVGYAMLKGCVYGLLFWLPTYLSQQGLDSEKGYISAMVDVGSLIGGMLVGHFGDKLQLRALFLSPLLFLGSVCMFIVSNALTNNSLPYYFLMFLIGNFTGGPYNVIGSAIAVDLAQQPVLKGTKRSISVISALVEGSAAIFSAVSQVLIPLISLNVMFVVFCVQSLVATVTLLPLFVQDLKALRERNKQKALSQQPEPQGHTKGN